jgi:hypothetical protein
MVDLQGWLLARCFQELMRSVKHLLRDGMPKATEQEITNLIQAAQAEIEQSPHRAYFKMYPPSRHR